MDLREILLISLSCTLNQQSWKKNRDQWLQQVPKSLSASEKHAQQARQKGRPAFAKLNVEAQAYLIRVWGSPEGLSVVEAAVKPLDHFAGMFPGSH